MHELRKQVSAMEQADVERRMGLKELRQENEVGQRKEMERGKKSV